MLYRSKGAENMEIVAKQFSVDAKDLELANPQIKNPKSLSRGDTVFVPVYQIGESFLGC